MELREVPDPQPPGPGQVLIRVGAVGVCGSDVHYYTTGRIGDQVVQFPFAVGHEGAGVVEAVGDGVLRVTPGQRIAFDPNMPCFDCDQCRKGRHHTCRNTRFLGCPGQVEGCLGELLVMPQESCYPIPDSMSLEEGSLSEPLSIGVYAVKLVGAPVLGKAVAVQGCGPIGLCTTLALLDAGAHVMATDPIPERRKAIRELGAWSGHPTEALPEEPSLVFECCGQQEALDQAVRWLTPGGKLMIVGIPEVDHVHFDAHLCRRKEIAVQNVRRQVDCVQPALDAIATGRMPVSKLVTHRYSLEESPQAFELVSRYQDGVIKAMIHVSPLET